MPTRDTVWPDGTPCWVDYLAADLEGAQAFYASVLSWSYAGGDQEYGGYLLGRSGGRDAAGLMARTAEDQAPRWTTYLAAADLEAAAGRVRAAGGDVVMGPVEVGPAGGMALAVDPQGNTFGLWRGGDMTGAQVFNEPGALVWNEAAVDDPAAARTFYAAVFGWRFEEVEGGGGYTTFAIDDRPLGGLGGTTPGMPRGWATCFSVADCDGTVDSVERGGGKTISAPTDMPYGRYAVVEDPWGASFTVMQEPAG